MLPLIACALLLAPSPAPPEVTRFHDAFVKRKGNTADEAADPAISKCLNLMLESAKAEFRANPEHPENVGFRAAVMLESVFALNHYGDEPLSDEYTNGEVSAYDFDACRMIVARMGAATRTVAYDSNWHALSLPAEFAWGTPWNRFPRELPSGTILISGDTIKAAGMRTTVRMVWLKRQGGRLSKVGEFEGETTIEFAEPQVKGDRVTAYSIDDPESFHESSSTAVFGRLTTLDCSNGRVRVVSVQLLHQTLRAIEKAVLAAHRAKHPTALQRRIRKLWLLEGDSREELMDWTEKRLANGIMRVVWNDDLVFDLKPGPGGYRVMSIRKSGN